MVPRNNDLIAAVEAAKQGVTVGEDTVPGFMFADDFVWDIRNTRRTAATNRESAGIHLRNGG